MSVQTFQLFTPFEKPTVVTTDRIIRFLSEEIENSSQSSIRKAIDFASRESASLGGIIITIQDKNQQIIGAGIMNKTGMSEYFPENLLVYLVIKKSHRRKGLGTQIIQRMQQLCKGEMAALTFNSSSAISFYAKQGINTYAKSVGKGYSLASKNSFRKRDKFAS